jgi:hypothetical protein
MIHLDNIALLQYYLCQESINLRMRVVSVRMPPDPSHAWNPHTLPTLVQDILSEVSFIYLIFKNAL